MKKQFKKTQKKLGKTKSSSKKKDLKPAELENVKNVNEDKKEGLDDFLQNWSNDDDSDSDDDQVENKVVQSKKNKKETKKTASSLKKNKESKDNDDKKIKQVPNNEEEDEEEESDDEEIGQSTKQQKSYLATLESKDPDFYKFLKENDEELLNFDESDSSEDENEEDSDDDDVKKESVHKPPASLEVDSDESDFEMETDHEAPKKSKKKSTVDKKMVDAWTVAMSAEKVSLNTFVEVVAAFKSAVETVQRGGGKETSGEDAPPPSKYKVEGGAMFNSVVRLCVTHIETALKKVLKLDPKAKTVNNITKNKHWTKVNKSLKSYTLDLIKLLGYVSEKSVVSVLLKHVHCMVPFYAELPKSSKLLIKTLIGLWSSNDEETVKILAFMNVLKLTQTSQSTLLEPVLKQMYLAYVKNCKFVSPSTRSNIAFMRRSLAEIMNLNHGVAYHHAFIYIRQLAIHLRNAITLQKKDSLQSVYNWQFVQSLHLWATLLGSTSYPSKVLEPLIHPLVQIITGTIQLLAIPKYYPLRFHLCRILTNLSRETGKFIPVLPYFTQILDDYNFNKKTKKLSMKPMDFGCILKCSKSQLAENGFKDTTIENVYVGIIEILNNNSHKIGFPEFVTPLNVALRSFLKKSKVPNYNKKIKQIMDKLNENSKFIEGKRRKINFGITESEAISSWELKVKADGTPVTKFYNNWKKVQNHEKLKLEAKLEGPEDDYDFIPSIVQKKKKSKQNDDFKGDILDQGEDEDDMDDEERFTLKEERGKKRKKDESSDEDLSEDEDDEDEDDEEEDEEPASKKKKFSSNQESSEEENEDDEVKDLNLEDLNSDEDGNESEEEEEEDDDNESDEDDESEDEGGDDESVEDDDESDSE